MGKKLFLLTAVLCGVLCAQAQNYENGHEWVDLGLPSGLKWATVNIGATAPEAYGDYFAWGETATKSDYSEKTYAYYTVTWHEFDEYHGFWKRERITKYNTNNEEGIVDNLTTLEASDDAAIQNWGGAWRMPAKDEWQELIDNCDWTWTDDYNGTEVAGCIVAGKNGNSIFLPATGNRSDDGLYFPYLGFEYWSTSLVASSTSTYLAYTAKMENVDDGAEISHTYRYSGLPVRPVAAVYTVTVNASENGTVKADKTAAPAGDEITLTVTPNEGCELGQLVVKQGETEIAVSNGKFTMPAGEVAVTATFTKVDYTITVEPTGNGTVEADRTTAQMGDEVTLTVTPNEDFVLAKLVVKQGETEIAVSADYKFTMPAGNVTVDAAFLALEWVDLGLPSGLKWATMNVGATTPEASGNYYAWGETAPKETYTWDNYKYGSAGNQLTKYSLNAVSGLNGFKDGKTVLDSEDDVAIQNWGGAWRMPTDAEWQELIDNCDWTWTGNYNGTGVAGRTVTSKANGNSIFLPAAGFRAESPIYPGSRGNYWSSSIFTGGSSYAQDVYFQSNNVYRNGEQRSYGQSVRPVADIYDITVNAAENGKVVTGSIARIGEEVKIVAMPDDGYILERITVKQGETEITVSADGNRFMFTMPAGNVTVSATFVQPEWVDLGLPSGLKWAAYNVGATTPEAYGNHYAWGETEPKDNYSWDTYNYGTDNNFTKYCNDADYGLNGFTDNLTTLEAEDDAASVNWGGAWRMPTDVEWKELIANCDWTWTTLNGVNGFEVKSKANGNSIFLPAAGRRYDRNPNLTGDGGLYWSSSLYTNSPNYAWYMYFNSDNDVNAGGGLRYQGRSVRPVAAIYNITVNAAENGAVVADKATALEGDEVTLTVAPAEGYALLQLVVKQGETEIAVSDGKFTMPAGDVTVSAAFMKPEWVDLGLPSGLKWATMNIGATAPEASGNYYAWGEVETKDDYSWNTYKYGTSKDDVTKYNATDGKAALDPEDDAAIQNWGGVWRMPTIGEWQELVDNCDWTWTTLNGVDGYEVKSKANGNSIFLPAAGYHYNKPGNVNTKGHYWSSSLLANWPGYAWNMYFHSTSIDADIYDLRYLGEPVRPVAAIYNITVNAAENGAVVADKATALEGDEVTLTVAPTEGYVLGQLVVKQGETEIAVSDGKFTMPAGDVTVSATFKPKTPTAIDNAGTVGIYAEKGRIECDGDFRIYDVLGRDVTRMNGSLNGIYIVKCGEKATKIVVK